MDLKERKDSLLMTDQRVDKEGQFYYEKIIKFGYQEGIDYNVNDSLYTIISDDLKRGILIAENPLNANIEVSNLELQIFVDRANAVEDFSRIQEVDEEGKIIEPEYKGQKELSTPNNFGKIPEQEDLSNYEAEYHEWMAKAVRETHPGKKAEFRSRASVAKRNAEILKKILLEAKQKQVPIHPRPPF